MRINKYMATYGAYSRRKADALITAKRVRINNRVAILGDIVDVENDTVTIAGVHLAPNLEEVYLKFSKPMGVVSSYGDPEGRPNLLDYKELSNILPYSGRLDFFSSGLMLFSSDRELIKRLQEPRRRIEKEYMVDLKDEVGTEQLHLLRSGIVYEGIQYGKCRIEKIKDKRYRVIITEGKNRQIRNMFKLLDIDVLFLMRVRIGSIQLNKLQFGSFERLSPLEVAELRSSVGLEDNSVDTSSKK